MPGNLRRFIPNSGSGYTFCFTNAATTVVGTLTEYHPSDWNRGAERTSPGLSTLQEDCMVQPSFSSMTFWRAVASCVPDCAATAFKQNENDRNAIAIERNVSKNEFMKIL